MVSNNRQQSSRPWWRSVTPLSLVVLLSGAMVSACQSPTPPDATDTSSSPSPTVTGLKLGALLPATGDLASVGQPLIDALPLAVQTVNACGGINGADVTLIIEDSQTNAATASAAMTKLVEVDEVSVVVGDLSSDISEGALSIAVPNQVVVISPGSTSPIFTERAKAGEFKGFWARTVPSDTYQAEALAQLAIDSGITTVATAVINSTYGVGFEQVFTAEFEARGGTVVNKNNPVRYDPAASTLDTEAKTAFSTEAEAVLGVFYVETGAILLRSAYEQGLLDGPVNVLLTEGVKTASFPEAVGKTAEGDFIMAGKVIGTAAQAGGPGLAALTALWEEALGASPAPFVPHTWDAIVLAMLAAEAAGSNEGAAIADQLQAVSSEGTEVTDVCEALELIRQGEDINYQGASGTVDLDAYGDVVGPYDVWEVTPEGTIAVIDQVLVE